MKKLISGLMIFSTSLQAFGGWADGLSSAGKAGGEMLQQQILMERQNELDIKRIEREYELREQLLRRQEARQKAEFEQRDREENMRRFEAVHPDWRAIVISERFKQWKQKQPASIQGLANSDKAADAILMIDLYKRDQK